MEGSARHFSESRVVRPLGFCEQPFLRLTDQREWRRRAHEERLLGGGLSFGGGRIGTEGIRQARDPSHRGRRGKAFIRTSQVEPREAGLNQRVVVIEFESVEKAVATYHSAAYQAALQALG